MSGSGYPGRVGAGVASDDRLGSEKSDSAVEGCAIPGGGNL